LSFKYIFPSYPMWMLTPNFVLYIPINFSSWPPYFFFLIKPLFPLAVYIFSYTDFKLYHSPTSVRFREGGPPHCPQRYENKKKSLTVVKIIKNKKHYLTPPSFTVWWNYRNYSNRWTHNGPSLWLSFLCWLYLFITQNFFHLVGRILY
jgi:hypothetical protein